MRMCPMYRWRFDELFTVPGCVMCCSGGIRPGEKTILVSGCFCAQWSVAPARGQQYKERVSWVWGVQSDFLSPFPHSGGVKILIILSAVLTVRCSLLMSVLVAEPNQTVIEEHRTDSMMAEWNCISSSWGRLNFLSWRRKYSLCWACFTIESMWLSHFRSWEMVVPRNLNDSTAVTVLFMMVSGGRAGGFLLKSTIISTVLRVFSSRLLRLHQTASCSTSCL